MTAAPPSPWTKLHTCAAGLIRRFGEPMFPPMLADYATTVRLATKICAERKFDDPISGGKLFAALIGRLGIATTQAEAIRQVAGYLRGSQL